MDMADTLTKVSSGGSAGGIGEGPWLVVKIGPLGFVETKIRLETDSSMITSHGEGQVIVFSLQTWDMSTLFCEAWKDGRAIEALKDRLAKMK